jgi:hypothetical protein
MLDEERKLEILKLIDLRRAELQKESEVEKDPNEADKTNVIENQT